MKKLDLLAVLAIVMMGIAFVSCDSKTTVSLKSDLDSVSYLIGASTGQSFKQQVSQNTEVAINLDALIDGYVKTLQSESTTILGMELQEANEYRQNFYQRMQSIQNEKNSKAAEKFLAENKGKSGVITTESGLQYQVITKGTGPIPKLEDKIKAHYHGTLLDGTVFESSVQRGAPIELEVSNFIEGWKEGLQLMPVGSKYIFWIPPHLGYYFDPNSDLYGKLIIFELELLDIVKN